MLAQVVGRLVNAPTESMEPTKHSSSGAQHSAGKPTSALMMPGECAGEHAEQSSSGDEHSAGKTTVTAIQGFEKPLPLPKENQFPQRPPLKKAPATNVHAHAVLVSASAAAAPCQGPRELTKTGASPSTAAAPPQGSACYARPLKAPPATFAATRDRSLNAEDSASPNWDAQPFKSPPPHLRNCSTCGARLRNIWTICPRCDIHLLSGTLD